MSAVAYIRRSASGEAQASETMQRETVACLASERGDTIEYVYRDWGQSGGSESRTEYLRMLAQAESDGNHAIYAYDSDRLARGTPDDQGDRPPRGTRAGRARHPGHPPRAPSPVSRRPVAVFVWRADITGLQLGRLRVPARCASQVQAFRLEAVLPMLTPPADLPAHLRDASRTATSNGGRPWPSGRARCQRW
jgi:hypothetical protein